MKVLKVFGLAILAIVLCVGVTSAAGLWTKAETPLYVLPDFGFPALDDEGIQYTLPGDTPITLLSILDGWVSLDFSEAYSDTVVGLWLPFEALTSTKPPKIVARELETKMRAMKVGDISIWDLYNYLKDLFVQMQLQPAPATAVLEPTPAPTSAPTPASCPQGAKTLEGWGKSDFYLPEGCAAWVSSDPATVVFGADSRNFGTRFSLWIAGPSGFRVENPSPHTTYVVLGPGPELYHNCDGAPVCLTLEGGQLKPRR